MAGYAECLKKSGRKRESKDFEQRANRALAEHTVDAAAKYAVDLRDLSGNLECR